jgi:hypothetical protein
MLAAEAYRHVGMEDEQEAAAAWSAVAQIHATLALAGRHGTCGGYPAKPP